MAATSGERPARALHIERPQRVDACRPPVQARRDGGVGGSRPNRSFDTPVAIVGNCFVSEARCEHVPFENAFAMPQTKITACHDRARISVVPASNVVWLDDSLPELCLVRAGADKFSTVMVTAVWLHLDEAPRRRGMGAISDLLDEGGLLIMSLRHGPIPTGRRMFDVSAANTIRLAEAHHLQLLLNVCSNSAQQTNRNMGVTWTRLALRK